LVSQPVRKGSEDKQIIPTVESRREELKGDETVVIDFLHRRNISETITFRKSVMC